MSEALQVEGVVLEVRRSHRRSTLGLTVDRTGDVIVHAPSTVTSEEMAAWIKRKLIWVHQKLAAKAAGSARHSPPEFVTGEAFSFLGRSYILRLVANQWEPLAFDGEAFRLRRDARGTAQNHFRHWYVREGRAWLENRVTMLAPRVGTLPAGVRVRDLGFRWASCTQDGALNFNWRLLQLPRRLIDYVILHELTHLVEPNHGSHFWRRLELALPHWRELKEELDRGVAQYLRFKGGGD